MPFENATTIKELNSSWPISNDPVLTADFEKDVYLHLQNIKNVLQLIFKGAAGAGFAIPITASEDSLNHLTGLTSNLNDQLIAMAGESLPIGGIIEYNGAFIDIPDSFKLCDGNNGTPSLDDAFIYSTNIEADLESVGGNRDSIVVSHSHTASHSHPANSSSADGAHSHNIDGSSNAGANANIYTRGDGPRAEVLNVSLNGGHSHNLTIDTEIMNTTTNGSIATDRNQPPFYVLAYIMRIF